MNRVVSRVLVSLGLAVSFGSVAGATDSNVVAGRTFSVWVSPSFGVSPYAPFQDCARFSANQMCLDGCGDCGALVEAPLVPPLINLWVGQVPCGTLNLVWVGTSIDLAAAPDGANVMSASGLSATSAISYAMEGVEDPNCVLPAGPTAGSYSAN